MTKVLYTSNASCKAPTQYFVVSQSKVPRFDLMFWSHQVSHFIFITISKHLFWVVNRFMNNSSVCLYYSLSNNIDYLSVCLCLWEIAWFKTHNSAKKTKFAASKISIPDFLDCLKLRQAILYPWINNFFMKIKFCVLFYFE